MWLLGPVCCGNYFHFMHWIIMNYTDLFDFDLTPAFSLCPDITLKVDLA